MRLVDPLELALPDIGLLTVEDAETGEQLPLTAAIIGTGRASGRPGLAGRPPWLRQ